MPRTSQKKNSALYYMQEQAHLTNFVILYICSWSVFFNLGDKIEQKKAHVAELSLHIASQLTRDVSLLRLAYKLTCSGKWCFNLSFNSFTKHNMKTQNFVHVKPI